MKPTESLEARAKWLLSNDLRVDLIGEYAREATSPPILARKLGKRPLSRIAYHTAILSEHGLLDVTDRHPREGTIECFYAIQETSSLASVDAIKSLIVRARRRGIE